MNSSSILKNESIVIYVVFSGCGSAFCEWFSTPNIGIDVVPGRFSPVNYYIYIMFDCS